MKMPTRKLRGVLGMIRLVRDPNRLNEVFEIIEGLSTSSIIDSMIEEFRKDATGARALLERPRVGVIDLEALRRLPPGTLGREYAEHMIANGLDPRAIPTLRSNDPRSFVRAHLYESHDIWHAVTGFRTDVAGELGLQAFGLAQFPSRLGAILIAGGLLHTVTRAWDERDARMREIVRGWLMGKRAHKLFGLRWAELWERPLGDLRRELGVVVDPDELRIAA